MNFEPVVTERSTADKAMDVLLAFSWLAFFLLLTVSPVLIIATWRALL